MRQSSTKIKRFLTDVTNPFFSQKTNSRVDPDNIVLIPCVTCQVMVRRSEIDGVWCHHDEELFITAGRVILSDNYDHPAVPDVIDVGEVSD